MTTTLGLDIARPRAHDGGMTTTTTPTRKPRTERVKDDQGHGVTAGEGAVRQDGTLPCYRCTTCGREVVWATSSRTGRKYLANVRRGYMDQRYYVKASSHDCTVGLASRAEFDLSDIGMAWGSAAVARTTAVCKAYAAGQATKDEVQNVGRDQVTVSMWLRNLRGQDAIDAMARIQAAKA